MRRIITLLALAMSFTANAQRLKVHGELSDSVAVSTSIQVNEDVSKHLTKAGIALQRSSICEAASWSFAFLSIMSFTNAKGDHSGYNNKTGIACAIIAGVSKVLAVSYKHRSGTELQIAAGAISVTF